MTGQSTLASRGTLGPSLDFARVISWTRCSPNLKTATFLNTHRRRLNYRDQAE
jgi:hypothetical protein